MKRVRMIVAYDGSGYSGWQIQPNAPTIEEVLNRELSILLKEEITVMGASRTDAGVHALGNIAVFDTNARMPGEKISYALNQSLPEDIRIRGSGEVPPDWHPRYQESRKTYCYTIYNDTFPMPVGRNYMYFTYVPLQAEPMQQACRYLIGEHDFVSFCNAKAQVKTTVRTIFDCRVRQEGRKLTIQICGSGFLYNMVRIIAGTLIQIGQGLYPPEQVSEIIAAEDRAAAGPTAPACGLLLKSIEYME